MKGREKRLILILILISILLLFVHIISAAEEPPKSNYIPPVPSNLSSIQGNFWVNHTWQAEAGNVTDSYNVSVNGTWTNGTTNTHYNTTVGPHGWSNITVWAYNNSGNGSLSSISVSQDIQIVNNVPFQYLIGNKMVNENENLQFNVTATDADSDQITYGTNATKGTFNTTTGNFSWTPAYGDAGVYFWYFNSSDGFGGISIENIAVTVSNVPLSITSSSPAGDTTITVGTSQTFGIALNRTADVTWYINGSIVQTNSSVISADYTNSTAGTGVYNVTAIAGDSYDSASRIWYWTVIPQPTYNISGYVFDNYDSGLEGVLVQNNSKQNTTETSGYYLITYLLNGTYNFSYSKTGFNTGYLEVTISGADNNNANITIHDTTPPSQVTGLMNDTPTQTTVNLTWNSTADANYYQVFRNSTSIGYTKSTYWNDTGLTAAASYDYVVRANDSYSNWGQNSSILSIKTSQAIDTTPPASVSNPATSAGSFYINNTWINPADIDFNQTWFRYSNDTTLQNVSKPVNYLNLTWQPHYIQNISAQTVDTSGNVNQTKIWFNTTIPDNAPFQYAIGNKMVNENENLQFNVTATDADSDLIMYGTNATKGTFNTTTGNFFWTPGYGDAGVYVWYFNSSDGYGGVASETITVTVGDVPLSITSSSPASDPTTTVGTAQAFGIAFNRTADVTWYINGSKVQTNSSVVSADYTNLTAGIGEYNVTAIANDSYYSASRTWNWTVIAQPEYNVSGYVFDNYGSGLGGVLVLNGSSQNTTLASGYYLITGLLNGTYNFSYSRPGFNTGYLEFTVNGADNTSVNTTIYDTTSPASVSNATSTAGNFYINNTWTNPVDANFNYAWFKYSNGTNLQNVSSPVSYLNMTWPPHYTQNISAQTVDTYGNINQTMVWFNTTIPNNAPVQSSIGDRTVTEEDLLAFTVSATDADNDIRTYGTNATRGNLNSTTGIYSWQTSRGDAGTYVWYFNSSDGYGGIASETITIIVTAAPPLEYIPSAPVNLTSTQGNSWVNHTWQTGAGNVTDSYNVSVNGIWTNGTTNTYYNSTVGPHGWSNITVWAYNNSGNGSLSSTSVSQDTQVANNAPILATIGNKIVNEGDLLAFTVSATDTDNDAITYGTNATKGTFNTTTGEFSWIPGYGDAGTYIWYFNSSDGYGGIANEIITVIVNNVPLSIASFMPVSDPTTIVGTIQTFVVDLNRTADVRWYINGSAVQTNSSVISASYTNSTADIGVYNITAIASGSYDSASRTWYWTVIPQPTYNVSGYVFDSHSSGLEGVQVLNNSKQSTTSTSGYYLITGLLNSTYNFSYSKAGFNTGYLEVTVSGADINNANITIHDTTPPASVSSPATTTGNFYINNTWINPANADFGHTWFKYSNGTTLQNVSSTISYLNLTWLPHYTQNISAQTVDTYDNINQTKVWFKATIPNNVPVQSLIGDKTVTAGDLLTFTVTATDADSDTIIYGTNATKGALNSSTGVYLWTTTSSDIGTYIWSFNSTDGYGGVDNKTITVTVNPPPTYIPPVPSYLSSTQGNFWINHTWQAGAGNKTDSYNISVNGVWTNGTTATYSNNNVGAHGWSNISVWAYNNSGNGSLSLTSISQSTQVNNNAPVQSQMGDLIVTVGDPLIFTVSATDEDSDVITYGTNATKGTLDPSTGEYSWLTTSSDIGTYVWSFNSIDGYGGVDNEIITVTVTAQSSPTNQNMGVKDTLFADYTENMCRGCHTQGVSDYHHLLDNNKYSCSNCHPINGSQITIVRDCKTCHENTFNNMAIRRPHHETKNAENRLCSLCHGNIVDDFDDNHYIPTYDLSFTTPSTTYKAINYTTGNKLGGCESCHKQNDTYAPRIYSNNETHHMLGNLSGFNPQNSSKCEACHEYNGLYQFDSIRYCQKCHSVKSLHNMQHDYVNTSNLSGHGHIGSYRDCNGCHAFWVTADIKPAIDSIIPTVDTISTSKINAGNNTTLTINGDNFLHSANISVVILVNDTYNMTLNPDALTDTQIAVTIPSLEKGRYGIYVLKNGKVKSNKRPIVSVPEVIIDSAKKSGTIIPIRGSGFGYYDPTYINFTNVTITTIDKKGVVTYRRVRIDDWNDTLINVYSTDAAVGDNVTVNSVFGYNSTKVTR